MRRYKEYLVTKAKVCLQVPHPFYPLIILACVVIIGGGLLLYYAEDAVPGEFLYPLEQSLEEVREFLAFTPLAKAEIKVARAEERVMELEQIRESRLTGVADRGDEYTMLLALDDAFESAVLQLSVIEVMGLDDQEKKDRLAKLYEQLDYLQSRVNFILQNDTNSLDNQIIDDYLEDRQQRLKTDYPAIQLKDYLK